jgi:DNA modification methylase
MNKLYFGDCLDILKKLYHDHPEGFIDLIYIDPPFNSKRNYNILFKEAVNDAKAQKEAFSDTWSNVHYLDTLNELKSLDLSLTSFLNALEQVNISKSAISYLTTMAIRIWYMYKALKDAGSFYLHCDPTMSHYLKIVCDLIFGEKNFKNEIIWKRTNAHNDNKRANSYGAIHDIIFYYCKSKEFTWNKIFTNYNAEYFAKAYNKKDSKGYFKASDLTANNPGYYYKWKGIYPSNNRYWAYSEERMKELDNDDRIYYSNSGKPYFKNYTFEMEGIILQDLWYDIISLTPQSQEKLGYPTQKPIALMERIISASSNEGDLVADFFCGCGTTISAAQKLKRQWLGVDISHLAVGLIEKRLNDSFTDSIKGTYEVFGFPKDLASARQLADNTAGGKLKFEEWIIEVMLHGVVNEKRNTLGYDGHFVFELPDRKCTALIEVKGGHTSPTHLNHFIATANTQKADLGIFVCFADQVTANMRRIAKQTGPFMEQFYSGIDKFQIITVEDLLDGKRPDYPRSYYQTFKKAKREETDGSEQMKIF